ncbi:MAG: FHA domain-containing protein [Candidatus Binataceae bacterium]|nr:FHA domain-containing protein [Candidatus Binataceae bacterium]
MLGAAQPARLLALEHRAPNTRLALLGRHDFIAGRAADAGLKVMDADIQPRHAVISYRRGKYRLRDLRSSSGTFLNNRRIRRTRTLRNDDRLRFGAAAHYRFLDPDAAIRRRHRRMIWASALATGAILGWLVHQFRLDDGWLSVTTVTAVADLLEPDAASRPVHPLAAKAARPATIALTMTPSSVASPSPAEAAAERSSWLARINRYRTMAGLGPVHELPAVSAAAQAHSGYLLANFADKIRSAEPLGDDGHEEQPGRKNYSAAGAAIAPNSQLAWGCGEYDPNGLIDQWIAGPFHRLPMLDPLLAGAGFGEASANGCWSAAMLLKPPGELPSRLDQPIEFPPDGGAVPIDWSDVEFPDPLISCPGYQMPVGLPITLQLGRLFDVQLTDHSLTEDGVAIEHCAFDAREYRNPVHAAQEYGRWVLRSSGAVVLIPRVPLKAGKRYRVSITAHGKTYVWTFLGAI